MLEVKNISSGYGKKQVLYDVSLKVEPGEVVLLTGGNGSGKSTLLKCIYNLLLCWSGEIWYEGEKINGLKPSDLITKGIVYIPQKENYFENLTVKENLLVSGSIYSKDITSKRIENVYNNLPMVKQFESKTPFRLSGGEKQLLALGIALVHNPKLILIDEPFAGLDEINSKTIIQEIIKLKNLNVGILVVEHKKHIDGYIDNVLNMYLGKLVNN